VLLKGSGASGAIISMNQNGPSCSGGKGGKVDILSTGGNITVESGAVTLECESKYQVTPRQKDQVSICNLRPLFAAHWGQTNYFDPQDGNLEILVQPIASGFGQIFRKASNLKNSIIPFKKMTIRSKDSLPVVTDGQKILKTPVKIEIAPKKLKLVVGKNRMF